LHAEKAGSTIKKKISPFANNNKGKASNQAKRFQPGELGVSRPLSDCTVVELGGGMEKP